MIDSMLVS